MNKAIRTILPVLMIIVWLLPVSNQLNTINESMIRNCFIFNSLILFLAFVYERKINYKQMEIAILIIAVLTISTILFVSTNKTSKISVSYGYLLQYIPYCLLINIRPEKLRKSKVLDSLFIASCTVVIIVGILTVLHNTTIESVLKTYYINHYAHVYISMFNSYKTVTFFATHSIACYIYFIMWWLLDYRAKVKKGSLNYILMAGVIFNIIMCLSVSAVLCVGLIALYYYISWAKRTTRKNLLRSGIMIGVGIFFIILNINRIQAILSSDANGLLGRFGSSGNLNETLKWAITHIIPLGICDVENFWLTDGGYFTHFLRGGILLVGLMYYGLIRFIKINVHDKNRATMLTVSIFAFEVGYQFIVCMRFFMIMLFAIIYFQSLECEANPILLKVKRT